MSGARQTVAFTRCLDFFSRRRCRHRNEFPERIVANAKQSTARRLKMSERAQQQMDIHFPGISPEWIWRRKTNDGFTTLPRTLPIIMEAIDAQSKGQPAGHTLFCLWARSPDHPLITIENPATFASEAGFTGERAVDTWRKRMKRLHELWMIQAKPGPSGDFHYVLLYNPNSVMEWMHSQSMVQTGLYGRFIDRLVEVGGFGEVEAVRASLKAQANAAAAAAAATAAAAAAAEPAPRPPKPPAAPSPSVKKPKRASAPAAAP